MAIKTNITIDQGTDVSYTFNIKDSTSNTIGLEGYTAKSQFRKYYTSSKAYMFDAVVNPVDGSVTLTASSTYTSKIPAGRYLFDCELISASNIVTRLVEGIVTVTAQVTR